MNKFHFKMASYELSTIKLQDIQGELLFINKSKDLSKLYEYRIRSQGRYPDCGACSVLSCIEYLRQIEGYPYESFSLVYHYYMAREIDKHNEGVMDVKFDGLDGVNISSSFESLIVNGVKESAKTLITQDILNTRPDTESIEHAKSRLLNIPITLYNFDINIDVFRYVLDVLGIPFVIAFRTTKTKLSNREACIITKEEGDVNTSYHAVCVVGYDDEEQVLLFQNSYGETWKYAGFGKLHYSCISNIDRAVTLNRTCVKSENAKSDDINATTFIEYITSIMLSDKHFNI